MKWLIGMMCILVLLGILTAGVAVTIAGNYQTD